MPNPCLTCSKIYILWALFNLEQTFCYIRVSDNLF